MLKWRIVALLGLSMWFLLAGCQTLGPSALGVGRGAYNDVIARTSSEQTLGLLVRLRYSDPIGLLTVSSVTAGLKFSAEAKGEAGFEPRANAMRRTIVLVTLILFIGAAAGILIA